MMHIKFPAIVRVLRVVINEEHVMSPHMFPQDLKINVAGYVRVLETIGKLWKSILVTTRPSTFLQSSHKPRTDVRQPL